MVSEQPVKKRRVVTSDIPSLPVATPVQDHGQDELEERNRTGETSGRRADMDCPGQKANGRAARELGEVDELFSKLRKKVKAIRAQPSKMMEIKKGARKKKKVAGSKDDIFGEGSNRPYRVGADGLKVFTEEELKVGQGGNTDLCPFDCQCCF